MGGVKRSRKSRKLTAKYPKYAKYASRPAKHCTKETKKTKDFIRELTRIDAKSGDRQGQQEWEGVMRDA